jgi:mRNA-degrading endonuclease RelE of RelBE toxin-antitoxin system
MSYRVRFAQQAVKDFNKLTPKLRDKVKSLCENVLTQTPREGKRLLGDLKGSYSLRISYQDRLVYSIDEKSKTVFVERCKTHYGD